MDHTKLPELRGDVITRTINVESIMSSIITQHYFNGMVKDFFVDVLYDEGFSWRLKCSIFGKIIENPDKQKLADLGRLGGIRNRFAHYGVQMSKDLLTKPTNDTSFEILDHRKGELGVDFEELYREFMDLAVGVEQYLARIYESLGGKWYIADEMAALGRQKKEINHIPGKNASMSMSDEQKTKIYDHLKNVGVHSICTACNQEVTWKQADTVTILGITEDVTPDLSRGIPLIPIICENCGYVRFFSAKTIGLFEEL